MTTKPNRRRRASFARAVPMLVVAAILAGTGSAWAGKADVVDATARRDAGGSWTFEVTVQHADTGWDHYANRWEVLGPDGTVLATRVLYHPHVDEQPFTRGLAGIRLPEGIDRVTIRAHDSVHGFGGKEMDVKLRP